MLATTIMIRFRATLRLFSALAMSTTCTIRTEISYYRIPQLRHVQHALTAPRYVNVLGFNHS